MAMNFNRCNPFSSLGIGLGNEAIDFRLFLSSTDSNSGLNVIRDGTNNGLNFVSKLGLLQPADLASHTVTQVTKTFVSPQRSVQLVHSVIDYAPVQNLPAAAAFPLTDVAVTHEVVKTTRFLTSTSTMDRMFGWCDSVRNQRIFPTNGVFALAQANQVINPSHSQKFSRNLKAFNVLNQANLYGKVKRETDFDPTTVYPSQQSVPNQGLICHHNLNNFNYNMNVQERDHPPLSVKPIRQVRSPSSQLQSNTFEEISDENDYDYPLGYDGRTHSLPNYPDGEYGCPRCFAAFDSSQLFASHIRTHYLQETNEERKRRMAAKCRRKNLRLVHSRCGLTLVPDQSFKRRKNRKQKIDADIENLGEIIDLEPDVKTPEVAAKKGPFHGVMIKVEPM